MKILLNDIKSARWAIIVIIAYFAFLQKYIYTICPVVLLTGFPCPGCGMTRALICLLRFDFAGAWKMHPFIFAILFLVCWFIYYRYIANRRDMKTLFHAMVLVGIAMIIFYIWRMYEYFPVDSPMNYYHGSVLGKIKDILK